MIHYLLVIIIILPSLIIGVNTIGYKVEIIGGAEKALEVDAKRAIEQATKLALHI